MKKYNFLFKPVFYILSLLFAIWLVTEIEKISPSDFGFSEPPIIEKSRKYKDPNRGGAKNKLMNLCSSYKAGMIDSCSLNKELTIFLDSIKTSAK